MNTIVSIHCKLTTIDFYLKFITQYLLITLNPSRQKKIMQQYETIYINKDTEIVTYNFEFFTFNFF